MAGVLIVASFSANLEQELRDDLDASLDRLAVATDPKSSDFVGSTPFSDPRYDTSLSGLYWQVDDLDRAQSVRSRSLWTKLTTAPTSREGTLSEVKGPDGRTLIVRRRDVTVVIAGGPRRYSVAVAEARDQDGHPFDAFTQDLILAFAILGVAAIMSSESRQRRRG